MRLTYLSIPLFALLLAGCGDDEPDTALPMDNEAPAEEAYGTPVDPADQPMSPTDDTPAPATDPRMPADEPMPPAEDPMNPPDENLQRSLDRDPGLGTDSDSPNERVDPGIDSDTSTTP
ncbi:hypothetical protein DHB74_08710 [Pseudomonas sp. G11-1]|uniref:Lipoprotein n=1 Tax=Halopseudomonas bauzanensis TaxID=653930 RepID=A0A031MHI8_9GAMM|nr:MULTISPECIES: hypothetical protein [Halopseudomonas]MCO5786428.1 hypothetical protein [Pseudomonas sp. G11-1]MCO5789654.1 hypothetical protein [Pseudomonas sp. G11-2]EZQ18893.1 hypothetical protein CF98_16620 [Halopseudomonas bauzanensis]TKA92398.1 hypothetical protein FA869_08405 [Halopseudomonas bauzanensis]WGK62652.1 hypothetical protein QAO71_05280 [Halopseudomonas sp. SMJS2]